MLKRKKKEEMNIWIKKIFKETEDEMKKVHWIEWKRKIVEE